MLQWSTVSRGFEKGVQSLICSQSDLLLVVASLSLIGFESRLISSWALSYAVLAVQLCPSDGPHDLAALSRLKCLRFVAWDMADGAHADMLLQHCDQLLELSWMGQHLPMVFPPTLRWLQLEALSKSGESKSRVARTAANDLMGRLAKLPQLQYLTLLLGNWGHLPFVRAKHLPILQCLAVGFRLANVGSPQKSDMRWLREQSGAGLIVQATLDCDPFCEEDLAKRFQGLPLQQFYLVQEDGSGPLHQAWRIVKATQRIRLTLAGNFTHSYLSSGPELHLKLQTSPSI